MSKGFAYIMFSTQEEMKKAIEAKNKSKFKVKLYYSFLGERAKGQESCRTKETWEEVKKEKRKEGIS